jgi:hypothetical protein
MSSENNSVITSIHDIIPEEQMSTRNNNAINNNNINNIGI